MPSDPFSGGIPRKKRPVDDAGSNNNNNADQSSLSLSMNMAPIPRRPSSSHNKTSGSGHSQANNAPSGGYSIPRKASVERMKSTGSSASFASQSVSNTGNKQASSNNNSSSSNQFASNSFQKPKSRDQGDVDTNSSALYASTGSRGRKALLSRKAAAVAAAATSTPVTEPSHATATSEKKHKQLKPKSRYVSRISKEPLIVRVNIKDLPLHQGISTSIVAAVANIDDDSAKDTSESSANIDVSDDESKANRISSRTPKRPRVDYQELEDTDDEDDNCFADQISNSERSQSQDIGTKRIRKKPKLGGDGSSSSGKLVTSSQSVDPLTAIQPAMEGVEIVEVTQPGQDVPPPPGTLSTLWYSRECFATLWVLEKLLSWKKRHRVELVTASNRAPYFLDHQLALQYHSQLLTDSNVWNNTNSRMEISRLQPNQCPTVLELAAVIEAEKAKTEGREPDFVLERSKVRDDEVVLVKWRGRSYWHCSWERLDDLRKFDPNNTARQKIKRYLQQQEQTMGLSWKQQVDEERARTAEDSQESSTLHSFSDEDLLPPECLEVERILACDENEINMRVLAKQRACNIRNEQDTQNNVDPVVSEDDGTILPQLAQVIRTIQAAPKEWDPEDNVRYVVKWKGLSYTDITWEYWRDIKVEAVDEAEDFWYRQKPPSDVTNRPHPHVRDFQKLVESPVYGISSRDRPIGDSQEGEFVKVDDEDMDFKGFRLRSYQLEGVNWLLFNWWHRRSCILADEMGLGKTIQSAAFLQQLQCNEKTQVRGPFLIVAPLSLVGQWKSELKSWAPDINCVLYHGSNEARQFLVQQEFYFIEQYNPKSVVSHLKRQHVTKFHVLITTYEVAMRDIAVLSNIHWKALIVDEAHRLKNSEARLFDDLAKVPRDFCVLLTGTPIANATEELWALLHFANPSIFTDKTEFLEKFGQMKGAEQVNELHSILKPYLLRRVKEDVEKSLPPKEETILEVTLTPIQKAFYKAIYERNTSFLCKGAKPSNAPSLNNVMMELRKCCNHPYLIKGAEERILAEAAEKIRLSQGETAVIDHIQMFGEHLIKSSGKMVLMEKLLQKLLDGGHKVLVFSQMVRMLDLLEELLKIKKYKYERLDGSTRSSSRLAAVDRFNKSSFQRFVMLLSTRAGGLGLNLTSADTVIIFDSDWNPQNDLQAMARAHRIGQTRAVNVYRFLTAKTYEMHMFHSASLKLGLEQAVLSQNREQSEMTDDGNTSNGKSKRTSDKEAQAKKIDNLLKKGAYDVFRDDDDTEAEKFMETDIDQLLEKKSKKVVYGTAKADASLSTSLGSFSKASFVTNVGDGEKDVDLDDPDFWSKAIGLKAPEEVPEEVAAMIDDGIKRNRKQVDIFDPYADRALAEQKKKEKIEFEKMMEKQEKERQKLEKAKKKKEAVEKKKREREEKEALKASEVLTVAPAVETVKSVSISGKTAVTTAAPTKVTTSSAENKALVAESKPKVKKSKKNSKLIAARKAENIDPAFEKIKQAWDLPQCTKVISAAIRFGFGRFAKIRAESGLIGMPLQDIEVFFRSLIYQLALQVAASLLQYTHDSSVEVELRDLFSEWIGSNDSAELDWLCESLHSVMCMQFEIENKRRYLRMPNMFADSTFVHELRRGCGLRALRRIGILNRLNGIVDDSVNAILASLGRMELGKRGCGVGDISELDIDLKSRHVTREELFVAIGTQQCKRVEGNAPTEWWDRNCDVALIVGSFIHGLGNYHAMQYDPELPYLGLIKSAASVDTVARDAEAIYNAATKSVRKTFDTALNAAKEQSELKIRAAVAEAAKTAAQREADAALLRNNVTDAEVVTSVTSCTPVKAQSKLEDKDLHCVTLQRVYQSVQDSVYQYRRCKVDIEEVTSVDIAVSSSDLDDDKATTRTVPKDSVKSPDLSHSQTKGESMLQMPDSRILDSRLLSVLESIEDEIENGTSNISQPQLWKESDTVSANNSCLQHCLGLYYDKFDVKQIRREFDGIGFSSYQCGLTHRLLNDGSSYLYGSASPSLSSLAYGSDAVKYVRGLGVPMNFTRLAVTALAYSEDVWLNCMIKAEEVRNKANESKLDSATPTTSDSNSTDIPADHDNTNSGSSNDVKNEVNEDSAMLDNSNTNGFIVDGDIQHNSHLRAAICTAVLFHGFPQTKVEHRVMTAELLSDHVVGGDDDDNMDTTDRKLTFDHDTFCSILQDLYNVSNVPSTTVVVQYVESVLLPFCLQLCLHGNGSTTKSVRGRDEGHEIPLGVSLCADPSSDRLSSIPDPCLKAQDHSIEAVTYAYAILRRVRMLRVCQSICCSPELSNAVLETTKELAGNKEINICKVPMWWSPTTHDVMLLLSAAQYGLFSVLRNAMRCRSFSDKKIRDSVLEKIKHEPYLQKLTESLSTEELDPFTQSLVDNFPTFNQVERRLAYICYRATELSENYNEKFVLLPMFDHGGWPRS